MRFVLRFVPGQCSSYCFAETVATAAPAINHSFQAFPCGGLMLTMAGVQGLLVDTFQSLYISISIALVGGDAMTILGWIIFGLVVGIIARFLIPGPQPMGMIMTMILGVLGSFVGGTLLSLFQGGSLIDPVASGWIGSIIGSIVLLLIYGMVAKRSV
jgi:uncharacterized membrane protein YeaQ/YmgE (transglycosylase-associated protein family)